MAVKFDKEMILKHRFWVMLGAAVLLVLVGMAILEFPDSEALDKLKADYNTLKGTKVSANDKTIQAAKLEADELRGLESKVWKDAYDPQGPIYVWSEDVESAYGFANGYFANEIKISKLNPDKKTWPADTEFLIHGVCVRQENDWVEIRARGVAPKDETKDKDKAKADKDKTKIAEKDKTADKDKAKVAQKDAGKDKAKVAQKDADKDKTKVAQKDADKDKTKVAPKDADKDKAKVAQKDADKDKAKVAQKDADKDKAKVAQKDADKDKVAEKDKGKVGEKDKIDLAKGIAKDKAKDADKGKDLAKNKEKEKPKVAVKVEDRTIRVYMTPRTELVINEDGKKIPFFNMGAVAVGKMLTINCQRGKYFNDPLTGDESRKFKESYKSQIHPILRIVEPLDKDGNGVVQLKNWLFDKDAFPDEAPGGGGGGGGGIAGQVGAGDHKFIRYVKEEWPQGGQNIDKEAWIAQEDLWIQAEIYRMIRVANDSVSDFTPKFEGRPNKRNVAYAFQNSYFDLELKLDEEEALAFTIKNRLERRQSIDLAFQILLNDGRGYKPEVIKVSGFPLEPAKSPGSSFTKVYPKDKTDRTGIFSVRQMLNWQTAAVKRIDQISIGSAAAGDISHSQRTVPVALRPFDEAEMKKRAQEKAGGGMGKVAGPMPMAVPMPVVPFGGGGKGGGGAGANGGPLPIGGLWTDRYVEVTDQARRLPVAVVLIVDQDHVDRVLNSFNNSKLRFLQTQVLLNQYNGSLQPPAPPEEKGDAVGGFPGAKPMIPNYMPKFAPMPMGIGPAGVRPEQPGSGGGDLETNMELVIYGIVTLYQRYPPRPPLAPLAKKQ